MVPKTRSRTLSVLPDTQEIVLLEKEELLKQLALQAATFVPLKVLQPTKEMISEIMLESNIDGIYYSLVRCRPRSNSQASLSTRELEIAKLVAQGLPNRCIGNILKISPWTVSTHLRRIFVKLDVSSRAAMVAHLMVENLL